MTAMTNVLPELLLALPVWPALAFVLWWPLHRAHPRLAEGLTLGALGLNVTLWALVIIGLPSAGTQLIWVRGGQFLDAPLSLAVDPLSAALGSVIAGLALLDQVFWAANGRRGGAPLLLWSLASTQLLLIAGHPLLLWIGWTCLTLAVLVVLRHSRLMPKTVAIASLGDIALIFSLLRILADSERSAPIAMTLSLAVAANLGLLLVCADQQARDGDHAERLLALGMLGLIPSALYVCLRYWPHWNAAGPIGEVLHWLGLAALLIIILRMSLDDHPLSVLCSWWLVELLLLLVLLPVGDQGLILYQALLLLITGTGMLLLLWLQGDAVRADSRAAAIAASVGLGVICLTALGVPWLGGYGGRTTLLGQAALDAEYIVVAGACFATLLAARALADLLLSGLRGGVSRLGETDAPLSHWLAWLPAGIALVLGVFAGWLREPLTTWLGLGAPLWQIDLSPLGRPLAWVPTLMVLLGGWAAWRAERKRDRWRIDGVADRAALPSLVSRTRPEATAWQRLEQLLAMLDPTALPNEALAVLICLVLMVVMLWGVG